VEAFREQATSGDYDNLLRTVMSWFSVDVDYEEDDNEDECAWCSEAHEDCECED
jgi:hypothetical protein